MSFYYSLMVVAELGASEMRDVDVATVKYLFGISHEPPQIWPEDPQFATKEGQSRFGPWGRSVSWVHSSANLLELRIGSSEVISAYRLIFHTQGNPMPEMGRWFSFFGWLAQFVHMDGPIGMYFSPDNPDHGGTVLSVYSRRMFYSNHAGERLAFKG